MGERDCGLLRFGRIQYAPGTECVPEGSSPVYRTKKRADCLGNRPELRSGSAPADEGGDVVLVVVVSGIRPVVRLAADFLAALRLWPLLIRGRPLLRLRTRTLQIAVGLDAPLDAHRTS